MIRLGELTNSYVKIYQVITNLLVWQWHSHWKLKMLKVAPVYGILFIHCHENMTDRKAYCHFISSYKVGKSNSFWIFSVPSHIWCETIPRTCRNPSSGSRHHQYGRRNILALLPLLPALLLENMMTICQPPDTSIIDDHTANSLRTSDLDLRHHMVSLYHNQLILHLLSTAFVPYPRDKWMDKDGSYRMINCISNGLQPPVPPWWHNFTIWTHGIHLAKAEFLMTTITLLLYLILPIPFLLKP